MALLPQRRNGIWQDEAYSLEATRGMGLAHQRAPLGAVMDGLTIPTTLRGAAPAWSVWSRQQDEPHPPVYFLVLRLWREVFGEGRWAARSLSTSCWLGAVMLTSMAAHRLGGVRAAAGAALAMGGSAVGAWYGQEIRGYAMAVFWVAGATYAMAGFLRSGAWRWAVGWAACALVGVLTHYYAGGVMLALGIVGVASSGKRWRVVTAGAGAAVVFCVAWLPMFLRQAASAGGYTRWSHAAEPLSLWGLASSAASDVPAVLGVPAFQGAALGAVLLTVCAWLAWRGREEARGYVPALASVVGGLGLVMMADLVFGSVQIQQLRYSLFALPGIGLLVGMLCAGRGWTRLIGWALVVTAALANLDRPRLAEMMAWPTVVSEARRLEGGNADDIPLVFLVKRDDATAKTDIETRVDLLALMFAYHSNGWRGPVLLLDEPANAEALASLAAHDRLLLVMAWRGLPPETVLPDWRSAASRTVPEVGVSVIAMGRGPTTAPAATSR